MSEPAFRVVLAAYFGILFLFILSNIPLAYGLSYSEAASALSAIISALGTLGLAAAAWLALDQIKIMKSEARRQTERDAALSIAEQIRLFRTEIITASEAVTEKMVEVAQTIEDQTGARFEYPAAERIAEFSLRWLLTSRPREALMQQIFWNVAEKKYGKPDYAKPTEKLLNAMEELAINILATKTMNNEGLRSIRKPFVTFVEINVWLMILTDPYSPNMYPAIRTVYESWAGPIDRLPREELKVRLDADVKAAADHLREAMPAKEYRSFRSLIDSIEGIKR